MRTNFLIAASLLATTFAQPLTLGPHDNTTLLEKRTSGPSGLELTLWTGPDCTANPSAGKQGNFKIENMVYGQNYPHQIRSWDLGRNLNPNEVLDFSNWDNDESGSKLALGMTGNAQACQRYMASTNLEKASFSGRLAGCHTASSPWLYFGCVSIYTQ